MNDRLNPGMNFFDTDDHIDVLKSELEKKLEEKNVVIRKRTDLLSSYGILALTNNKNDFSIILDSLRDIYLSHGLAIRRTTTNTDEKWVEHRYKSISSDMEIDMFISYFCQESDLFINKDNKPHRYVYPINSIVIYC